MMRLYAASLVPPLSVSGWLTKEVWEHKHKHRQTQTTSTTQMFPQGSFKILTLTTLSSKTFKWFSLLQLRIFSELKKVLILAAPSLWDRVKSPTFAASPLTSVSLVPGQLRRYHMSHNAPGDHVFWSHFAPVKTKATYSSNGRRRMLDEVWSSLCERGGPLTWTLADSQQPHIVCIVSANGQTTGRGWSNVSIDRLIRLNETLEARLRTWTWSEAQFFLAGCRKFMTMWQLSEASEENLQTLFRGNCDLLWIYVFIHSETYYNTHHQWIVNL